MIRIYYYTIINHFCKYKLSAVSLDLLLYLDLNHCRYKLGCKSFNEPLLIQTWLLYIFV